MKVKVNHWSIFTLIFVMEFMASCKTTETGGKVVDAARGEIIISSSSDQKSALPEGKSNESFSKARQNLEKSVEASPTNISNLLSLAQLQLIQDRFKESENTALKVLRIDLKNQEARKVLAQVAYRQNNSDLALIFISSLGGEESKDSSLLNLLGLINVQRGDNTEAMRLWKKALTINANDISVRMNLGVMFLKYKLISQASANFERVLKVAPNHQDARMHLAIIEGTKGNHAQAILVYNEILKEDKTNPIARYNLALSQKGLAQYDEALENLKLFIKDSPSKSMQTDQAFALIEEISGQLKQPKKSTDEEIRALAKNLETKKPALPEDVKGMVQSESKNSAQKNATEVKQQDNQQIENAQNKNDSVKSDLGADKGIEDLERELRAH